MGGGPSKAQYGSDYAVEVLRQLGIPYLACNPGASFRGLHDSAVNFGTGGGGNPEMIFCTHEEISVAIAHGYAKASGRLMAAAVHDVVGLQHSAMAIFNAWCDRAPVMVLGGTGPMAVETRRPWIDWIHTALVQGNQVRDYVKWDDQPATLTSIADSLPRAYRIAMTAPTGPVYINFDAELQEWPVDNPPELPDVSRLAPAAPPAPDPASLARLADWLAEAEHPVLVAGRTGDRPGAMAALVALAEHLGCAVIDTADRLNFPTDHPLNLSFAPDEVLAEADLLVALDVADVYGLVRRTDRIARTTRSILRSGARVARIGLEDYIVRSWASDYQRQPEVDLPILAETANALPQLLDAVRSRGQASRWAARRAAVEDRGRKVWAEGQAEAARGGGERPMLQASVAHVMWEQIKSMPFILANGDLQGWTHRVFSMREPRQFLGPSGGGGLGYGMGASVGAALAHRGSDKLVIDIQSDGDLMFTPGALWTAAHEKVPLLTVVVDNRSYYNSEEHQFTVARHRQRDAGRAPIATRIEDPVIDYCALARAMGVWAPAAACETPEQLAATLPQAIEVVMGQKKPALLTVVTQPRR
jgi:acetolactate synthase-1/2/3 large subunit